ncbi:MAG: hypothetical protein ACD_40C00290G0004 [uncultured bacterium]|nr:MAG: hypothetical protein ACD_40C00290G0004 [uncultured bacterium]
MGLLQTLQEEMKTAMRARDQARLDALRLMVSAIRYVEVDTPSLSDEQIIEVLKKEAKKRREAIEAYKAAGRDEQAKQEEYEFELIGQYLPKTMSEDEVREIIQNLKIKDQNYNMGEAMKIAMKEVGGKAEGGVVAKVVRDILQGETL